MSHPTVVYWHRDAALVEFQGRRLILLADHAPPIPRSEPDADAEWAVYEDSTFVGFIVRTHPDDTPDGEVALFERLQVLLDAQPDDAARAPASEWPIVVELRGRRFGLLPRETFAIVESTRAPIGREWLVYEYSVLLGRIRRDDSDVDSRGKMLLHGKILSLLEQREHG